MKCLSCQKETGSLRYHKKCLNALFGVAWTPEIKFGIADLPSKVGRASGKMSIAGVQIKALLKLNSVNKQLEIADEGGTYIFKPEPNEFPELPLNENLCMSIAQELKMKVPPHGLFKMADGKLAYVIKRFDRIGNNEKIHKEDMAQILNLSPEAKYSSSLEAVGNAIKKNSANPYLDLFDFFQRLLLNFTIGNGDMHLKNWSLLTPANGQNSLVPCYDFISSKIYLPDEEDLGLPLGGKKNKLERKDFEDFADYLGIDSKAVLNAIDSIINFKDPILNMIKSSFLNSIYKTKFEEIVQERLLRLKKK